MSHRKRNYRMLVVVSSGWEYGRNIILGARHHAFTAGRLEVGNWEWRKGASVAEVVRRQHVDGVIAAAQTRKMEEELLALPVPVVNVSNILDPVKLPTVTQDDRGVGRLAAEHLAACGCSEFAYWGEKAAHYAAERVAGFLEELERIAPGTQCVAGEGGSLEEEEEASVIRKMRKWLRKLAPQTGVFAMLDPFALQLMQAAREEGRRVPEDIAVLGAGDDEFWVDFENIPLTSVKLPSWQIGVEAAKMLEGLMRGGRPGKTGLRVELPVTEVAARRSTDVLYTGDESVAKAVAYIREHSAENVYVEDVARAAGVSRSGLQRKFAEVLGRSVLEEIQRERIRRVKTLLQTTEMKMTAIAEACDFPNTPRLHVLFRQLTGQTPGEYRARFRRR